jgi:hypothetical protein
MNFVLFDIRPLDRTKSSLQLRPKREVLQHLRIRSQQRQSGIKERSAAALNVNTDRVE